MHRFVAACLLWPLVCLAGEGDLQLQPDPSLTLVRANCSSCHSPDYVIMNSPFLKRTDWEAEVRKMQKMFGAPVAEEDVPAITDYLARHYGADGG